MTWDELIIIPQWDLAVQVIVRLLIAAGLGGVIGYERDMKGKAAGMRTHMLVCVGTARRRHLDDCRYRHCRWTRPSLDCGRQYGGGLDYFVCARPF
jgi:hypothetical protein